MTDIKNKFQELKNKTKHNDKELLAFFDQLPPVSFEDILYKWQGDIFSADWDASALQQINWYGKWFKSHLDAVPVICYNDKKELFSNHIMKGEATMWDISFRGQVSATLVYDHLPLFDHFRKVDDRTLMGILSGKPFDGAPDAIMNGAYIFFYLEKVDEFPAPYIS